MSFYLLQQPERLERLATHQLAVWIAAQAGEPAAAALGARVATVRRCLRCNLPRALYNDLFADTLAELKRLRKLDADVTGRMAETLFSEHLTSLALDGAQFVLIRHSLDAEAHTLTGLTSLELNFDSSFPGACVMDPVLIRLLKQLRNLKYLSINAACTDITVVCIVNYCTLLEELKLNRFQINAFTAHVMSRLPRLRSVVLQTLMVPRRLCANLLLSCKNIERIDIPCHHDTNRMSHILNEWASSAENAGKRFKLKYYKSDCDTLAVLQAVFRMCPLIENLTIRQHHELHTASNLMAIVGLRELRELTLEEYHFHHDRVGEALRAVGGRLQVLRLRRGWDLDVNAFADISEACPALHTLEVDCCNLIDREPTCTNMSETVPFRCLKRLSLDMTSSSYIRTRLLYLSQNRRRLRRPASFLLANCLNVEFVELTRTALLADVVMFSILDKNPLTHLKELKIVQCDQLPQPMPALNPAVIGRIVQNCQFRPEVRQVLSEPNRYLLRTPPPTWHPTTPQDHSE